MTSLRSGPLPRMAGRLTFMRAPEAHVADIAAESIAVLGVPIENNAGRRAGCRFGPLAGTPILSWRNPWTQRPASPLGPE